MIRRFKVTLVSNTDPFEIVLDPKQTVWVRLRKGRRFWVKFLWALSIFLIVGPFLALCLTTLEPWSFLWPFGLLLGMLPLLVRLPYVFSGLWVGVGPSGAGIAYRTLFGSFGFFEPLENFRGVGWAGEFESRLRQEREEIRHTIELRHRDRRRNVPLASYLGPPPNLPNSPFMGGAPDLLENAPEEKAREMARQLGLPILMEFDSRSIVLDPDEEPPSLREAVVRSRPEAGPPPRGIKVETTPATTVVTVTPNRWLGVAAFFGFVAMIMDGSIEGVLFTLPFYLPFFVVFMTDGQPPRSFEISGTTLTYARLGFFAGRIEQWSMPIDKIIGVSTRMGIIIVRDKRGNYNWAWPDLGTRRTAWLEAFLIHTLAGADEDR